MNKLLQWELDWVQNNSHRYEGPWHVRAVMGNITKRYDATLKQKTVEKWARTKYVRDELAVIEVFELQHIKTIWE